MKHIPSPTSVSELMARADALAGLTLGEIAADLEINAPQDLRRDKGWVGQLFEAALGAEAGSKPEQDFLHLGIELKSIPLNAQGLPLETTYVCVAPLTNVTGLTWEQSLVFHKLQRVLWIPVEGERTIPISQRHVGMPILWQPDALQQQQLRQDWEEIMELISMGKVAQISARHGEVLQLRPKAANSKAMTESIAEDGSLKMTNPRGFYLKTQFTAEILRNYFG